MRRYDFTRLASRRTRAILLMMTAAVVLLSGSPAYAAPNGSQGITMSPALTEISLEPGELTRKGFDIVNAGSDKYDVKIEASAYSIEGIEYVPVFKQLPGTTNVASWITFDKNSARIDSQAVNRFDYTITVPKNTAPGGYYAVLFAETNPIVATNSGGVIPHNRVGNLLYITVKGDVKTAGLLKGSSLNKVIIQPSPLKLGVEVTNTGGVHFKSKVSFVVETLTGTPLQKTTIENFVLPQTVREISTEWAPPTPIGVYVVKRSATVAGKIETLPDKMIFYARPEAVIIVVLLLLLAGVTVKKLFFSHKKPSGKK